MRCLSCTQRSWLVPPIYFYPPPPYSRKRSNESEDPAEKLEELRKFVTENLELPEIIQDLKNEYASLNSQVDIARQKWHKVERFLGKLGIDFNVDQIPF